MKKEKRRRSRSYRKPKASEQRKMDDNYYNNSSTAYLVESFTLNSSERKVARKGEGRKPDPNYKRNNAAHQLAAIARESGRKVNEIDLATLTLHFENYVKTVNLILSRIYKTDRRAEVLGEALSNYRGRAYTLLRNERDLCYQHNEDIKGLVYERLHRNALEHAGRTLLADWSRRQLFNAAITLLPSSPDDVLRLLRRKQIPSDLIRRVRDSCSAVKKKGSGYHYALGVLRQIRLAIDLHILDTLGVNINWRGRQRKKVSSLLAKGSVDFSNVQGLVMRKISSWVKNGYPFTVPQLKSYSLDFSASTENSTGQGYWFSLDSERENEVLLHLKLPPGIDGDAQKDSPYKSNTLTFRFLDWLPRAASEDIVKAKRAKKTGYFHRAQQLRFRAAKFEDMHEQLMNTIQFQHVTHQLSRLRQKKDKDPKEIAKLNDEAQRLKKARRSAPPRIILRGQRVVLQIPFLSPNGTVSSKVFKDKEYTTEAGADRGLRVPIALSVEKDTKFVDLLISVEPLIAKRMLLRKNASVLQAKVDKRKSNWEQKRLSQQYPQSLSRKLKHFNATWDKIRRLDREITRIIAAKTVWFCEEHDVKKLFFEDLRGFQGHAGSKDLSWSLNANLWGKIIETVRYMRESLGHSKYSVWTVNPRYTSQTCHLCGERGFRVNDESSKTKKAGGEFFYCTKCDVHHHADINAARNIIHVQSKSSVVPGRTA
ncbi:MAG: zinc ribbon domain-containing protein [Candidatus Thorarchaeota archaeon]